MSDPPSTCLTCARQITCTRRPLIMPYCFIPHLSATSPRCGRWRKRRFRRDVHGHGKGGPRGLKSKHTEMASTHRRPLLETRAFFSRHVDSSVTKESMARVGWLNAACSVSRLWQQAYRWIFPSKQLQRFDEAASEFIRCSGAISCIGA
jgi:hypothetical protein